MKVLVVGFGSIARKHYEAILKMEPDAEIIALRSRPMPSGKEKVYSVLSVNEAQALGPYDFAIVSNPTFKHIATISSIFELNCPLFIEKPLSDTLNHYDVINEVMNMGIKTYVGCNLRFLDSLVYLKNILIKDLTINEVNVYCGSFLPDWRPGVDYRSTYSVDPSKGGGVHLDLIHEIDYTYWLFGNPQSVRSFRSSGSSLDILAPDYANYLLTYEGFSVNIVLNYYRRDSKRTLELVCDQGTYLVDLLNNNISIGNTTLYSSDQRIKDTYLHQMEYFIKTILSGDKNQIIMNDISEAHEVLKICLQ